MECNIILKQSLKNLEAIEKKKYKCITTDFNQIQVFDILNKKLITYDNGFIGFQNRLLLQHSISSSSSSSSSEEKSDDIIDILHQYAKNDDTEKFDEHQTQSDKQMVENKKPLVCNGCQSIGTMLEDVQESIIVCSACGYVSEKIIDQGPEWRNFYNDEYRGDNTSRCSCPSNYFFPKTSQGTIITGSGNNRLKTKQKWNSTFYKEKRLNQEFSRISEFCANGQISIIIEDTAKIIYKQLSDCKHKTGTNTGRYIIIRGKNRISIIGACIFRACEMNHAPRTIVEIAECCQLDEKKITKGIKKLDKILRDSSKYRMFNGVNFDTTGDFIKRHCKTLNLEPKYVAMALRISRNCNKLKLTAVHNPPPIAACSILLMVNYYGINIEKKDIAYLFRTSEVTINKIYKKMELYVEVLVDNDMTDFIVRKLKEKS